MNSFDFSSVPGGIDYAAGAGNLADDGALATFFIAIMLFYLCFCAISFVFLIFSYVFEGLSLQKLAKRRAISKPWLAWIPFAKQWLLGEIASDYDRQNGKTKKWGRKILTSLILFESFMILWFIAYIPGIIFMESDPSLSLIFLLVALAFSLTALVLSIVLCVFTYICIYKIFKSTAGDLAWLFVLLAILVPISLPICLFIFRNKGYEIMPEDNLVVEQINT